MVRPRMAAGALLCLAALPANSAVGHEAGVSEFAAKVRQCWSVAPGAENIAVALDIELSAEGEVQRVDGDPEIVEDKLGQIAFDAALRAVLRCAPYTMFDPDRFERWRNIPLTLGGAR